MIKAFARYFVFLLVAAGLVYGGYRLLKPATSTPTLTEASESEHSDSVALSDAKVEASGIELAKASAGVLRDSMFLNGIVQPNQELLVQVTPRFPGIVRDVRKRIGDKVQKGDVLAVIESNQSLTPYELKASLAGTVINRQITLGEYASEQKPAFVVADLSTVWVDFSVYRRDLNRVSVGDEVLIDPADGGPPIDAKIAYLSPVGSSDTQSAVARAVVANTGQRLRPGLFATGRLTLSAKKVGVAVKSSALQTLENRAVVFVRNGDKFEARNVDVGQRDSHLVEITSGVLEGDLYAAQNSFIVKAEMTKGAGGDEH
ncbi:divalent metal ion exporter adaptor subunit IhpB [Afipia sp. TerB]